MWEETAMWEDEVEMEKVLRWWWRTGQVKGMRRRKKKRQRQGQEDGDSSDTTSSLSNAGINLKLRIGCAFQTCHWDNSHSCASVRMFILSLLGPVGLRTWTLTRTLWNLFFFNPCLKHCDHSIWTWCTWPWIVGYVSSGHLIRKEAVLPIVSLEQPTGRHFTGSPQTWDNSRLVHIKLPKVILPVIITTHWISLNVNITSVLVSSASNCCFCKPVMQMMLYSIFQLLPPR